MKIAIFGGSFDPVHSQHVAFVKAVKDRLSPDLVLVMPSWIAPHKAGGAFASPEDRLEMCRRAFSNVDGVEVSDWEIRAQGTSYSYLTCRHFKELYPDAEIYFLVGADMLRSFSHWKRPEEILSLVTLVACGRGDDELSDSHKAFVEHFGKDFISLPFVGKDVSSTRIRTDLAFGKETDVPSETLEYIREKSLYFDPRIPRALALEKRERQEHSYRVAVMATSRARSLGVSEKKALLASALHDCAKYLKEDSEFLSDFSVDHEVPLPVLHQYTGAFVAQNVFGVDDEEVLDAIRYHTSGRVNMTTLGKLVFLADMLESGRTFEGVEKLRKLFYEDIDKCLFEALKQQTEYLEKTGGDIYPLTRETYEYYRNLQGEKV